MSKLILKAKDFCKEKHKNQVRKYNNQPYYLHPFRVMEIVKSVPHSEEQLISSLLHDTVEDTDTTLEEIESLFGPTVANYVYFLTDISKKEDGNRKTRKKIDREHIMQAPPEVKTIKLADIIDNCKDLKENDPKFAKVYFQEKQLLLRALKEGDKTLYKKASKIIS